MGEGESGKLLKKMMKDRRVDKGNKWTPIFGRYGFPVSGGEVRVADEVLVGERLEETTVFSEFAFPLCTFTIYVGKRWSGSMKQANQIAKLPRRSRS